MNESETRRLAHATNELRPDWPVSSLTTFIRNNLANRPYRDAAVALAWVATDQSIEGGPASTTPKRVLENGPWWRAALIDGPPVAARPHPLKAGEDCPRHLGQPAANCGGCRADQLAEDKPPSPEPSWIPGDTAAGARAVRDALRAVRGNGNDEEGTQ